MSTKFAAFLTEKKIDARRILATSAKLEGLRPADRALKLAKRLAKGKSGDEAKKAPAGKPRSGRPVTSRALDAAQVGKAVSGPQKTRILRAVNAILEQKKQAAVELIALF
jgi:hypothetical protein